MLMSFISQAKAGLYSNYKFPQGHILEPTAGSSLNLRHRDLPEEGGMTSSLLLGKGQQPRACELGTRRTTKGLFQLQLQLLSSLGAGHS